jgi:hypothetical protein
MKAKPPQKSAEMMKKVQLVRPYREDQEQLRRRTSGAEDALGCAGPGGIILHSYVVVKRSCASERISCVPSSGADVGFF